MKNFNKICIGIIVFWLLLASFSSYIIYEKGCSKQWKEYLIDINRINDKLSCGTLVSEIDLSEYDYIKEILILELPCPSSKVVEFFDGKDVPNNLNYSIRPLLEGDEVVGYISFLYQPNININMKNVIVLYNLFLALMMIVILIILCYVRNAILKPFHEIVEMPYELSQVQILW